MMRLIPVREKKFGMPLKRRRGSERWLMPCRCGRDAWPETVEHLCSQQWAIRAWRASGAFPVPQEQGHFDSPRRPPEGVQFLWN
jgi:hypothetical protein